MHVGMFDLDPVKVIWGHSVPFSENWTVTHPMSHQLSPTQHRSLGKLYARDIITYVGLSKSYVGLIISYVGDNKSCDNKSYVGLFFSFFTGGTNTPP